jgi:hypothetical protein
MKKPRKWTRRGVKYDALAHGYKILNSPLAETFEAASEHFEKTDQDSGENQNPNEQKPSTKENGDTRR